MYRVIEVARMLGVSKVTIYKKMRYLKEDIKPYVIKEKNITHITNEGVELIKGTIQVQDYDSDSIDTSSKVLALENQLTNLKKQLSNSNAIEEKIKIAYNQSLDDQVSILKQTLTQKQHILEGLNLQQSTNIMIQKEIKQQISLFDEMIRLSS